MMNKLMIQIYLIVPKVWNYKENFNKGDNKDQAKFNNH